MVDLGTCEFKKLNFTNAHVEKVYESKHACTANKRLYLILNAKYKNVDLHKVMETQWQNLKITQLNELLILLQKLEELFDGTLGTWKKYSIDD